MIEPFQKLTASLERLSAFDETNLEKTFQEMASETGLKLGKIAQPVRWL